MFELGAPMAIQFPLSDGFDPSCSVTLSQASAAAIHAGRLKLTVFKYGEHSPISGLDAVIDALTGEIRLMVCSHGAKVRIGQVHGIYDIRLWRNATISIGDHTTSNHAKFILDDSEIHIGGDCMFSDDIIFQAADQHALVDLELGKIFNNHRKSIVIADHVWLGRRANILYGTEIGEGSIVGFGSLVNKAFPKHCLIAGVPAEKKRDKVTWSRSPTDFDPYSRNAVAQMARRD